jgi:hypothetical protein
MYALETNCERSSSSRLEDIIPEIEKLVSSCMCERLYIRNNGTHKWINAYGILKTYEEENIIDLDKCEIIDKENIDNLKFDKIYRYPSELLDYIIPVSSHHTGQVDFIGVFDCEYYMLSILNKNFIKPIAYQLNIDILKFC